MSYVTQEDYLELNDGEIDTDVTPMLEEISMLVNKACYGRIEAKGFDNLTKYQQKLIKRAVYAQLDFMMTYGDFIDSPLSGFSAGSISLSFKDTAQSVGGALVSNKVIDYLDSTGLRSRRL